MEKSNALASRLEKSKISRWVLVLVLVFMVGMFVFSATPFGLAVWLGNRDDNQHMSSRIQLAPLHREMGALAQLFQLPVSPQEVYWRETSMFRPLQTAASEDKALWAVLHYDTAGFEALLAQLPAGKAADTEAFLPWLVKDIEQNMGLKLSAETEVLKLPSEWFVGEGTQPRWVSAYVVPAKQSLLLMRFGATDFVSKP